MYEKIDVSPVKATDLLVFGQITFIFIFVGLLATERHKYVLLCQRCDSYISIFRVRIIIFLLI